MYSAGYMQAAKHKWAGIELAAYIAPELFNILKVLNELAPEDMRVSPPHDLSELVIAIYRLDTALDRLRPLRSNPKKPGSTGVQQPPQQEVHQGRLGGL
jgi:hypothetical protein